MRKLLQRLFTEPVVNLANKWSSRPDKRLVDAALSDLYQNIISDQGRKGAVITFDKERDKFIIFSDLHKGARDGADIFTKADRNYLTALDYYNNENFCYICLGDSEELWENLFFSVKKHNKATFQKEKLFIDRKAFIKIFGNHDLYWDNSPLAPVSLLQLYGKSINIYEGLILQTLVNNKTLSIFMTHGHQGDMQSDGNWFSKWFVSNIWGPFQSYLRINPNTPANNNELKTAHNKMMYQWSSKRKNTLLITGHTHQPVFKSFTHIEMLYNELEEARKANDKKRIAELEQRIDDRHRKGDKLPDFSGYLDTYFNSGCCCFDDGDITGIEITDGCIRLIKWQYGKDAVSERLVLEESKLEDLKV
ncbi:MAG: metallophosphoesterase [Mucilaginibacter sp.]